MSKKCYRYYGGLLVSQANWLNKMAKKGYRLIRTGKILYEFIGHPDTYMGMGCFRCYLCGRITYVPNRIIPAEQTSQNSGVVN